jgi:hypothetical protein
MAIDPEYAAVSIAVDHVDDHRQPAFRVTAGVDREWVDEPARAALAARVHALSNSPVLAHGFTPSAEARKDRCGRREFFLLDPDGNRLAFFAR